MDYNFWDDRTHEVEINPCEGCYDYQNRKCISNGGCGDGGTDVEDVTKKATEDKNNTRVRVKSAEIIVHVTAVGPYYEIRYHDISDGQYHIGYGSYCLQNVFKWLEECFEIVR